MYLYVISYVMAGRQCCAYTRVSTLCFNCGQTGHFQNQCPEPQRTRAARAPQYVCPPVEDRGGSGTCSFVDSVNLRGGMSLAMEDETIWGVGLVAVVQAQVNLQTELLEARALIERQAEIMEHQMRSAAQPATGPPGIRPRAGGAVSQIGGWSEFFGARSVAEGQARMSSIPTADGHAWGDVIRELSAWGLMWVASPWWVFMFVYVLG
jgi:hypothetical protein